nr:DUF3277 family protein [Candidatus Sigynarchaeota archaeon]
MGKPLSTYDPAQVFVTYGGFTIQGFADGSMITVERNEQAYNLYIGSDGEGARSKSNNKSAVITIRLMQTSDSNDVITAFAKADEITNSGSVPFMVKDGNGRTLLIAENAWVQKLPSVEFGKEALEREWKLESDSVEMFVGGN